MIIWFTWLQFCKSWRTKANSIKDLDPPQNLKNQNIILFKSANYKSPVLCLQLSIICKRRLTGRIVIIEWCCSDGTNQALMRQSRFFYDLENSQKKYGKSQREIQYKESVSLCSQFLNLLRTLYSWPVSLLATSTWQGFTNPFIERDGPLFFIGGERCEAEVKHSWVKQE